MKSAIVCFPKIGGQTIQYPTGLYKLASYCKDEYNIFVLDQRMEENVYEQIRYILDNYEVLCLGLSVMTGEQIKYAIEISRYFHKDVRILWGGLHPTILPEQTISCDFIDYIIRGEGEESFLNFLRYCEGKIIKEELFLSKTNLMFKYNYIKDLNSIYVNFNKYPIKESYFVRRDGFKRAFNIETSRGCPYACYFCHNSIGKRPYRYLKGENVTNLIEFLYITYNIDGIIFQEDNFFADRNRVSIIFDFLKSKKILDGKQIAE